MSNTRTPNRLGSNGYLSAVIVGFLAFLASWILN
jgi:hypothetical protein